MTTDQNYVITDAFNSPDRMLSLMLQEFVGICYYSKVN